MRNPLPPLTRIYLASIALSLLAFLFPASRLTIEARVSVQYLLTSYPGWIVLMVLILYMAIQGVFLYKNKPWNPWPAAVIGLYAAGFAVSHLYRSFTLFRGTRPGSLATEAGVSSTALVAPWLLAIGGTLLFAVSIVKINRRIRAIRQTL